MAIPKLRKYLFSLEVSLMVFGLLLFVFAGILNLKIEKPVIQLTKQETALNINKELLIFMSAGNKRLLTDLLWVQTLLESDLEHYENKDLNNWLFLRFNTISTLDPKFYENYLYGGQFLAIVKDDLEGASVIYEKGVAEYPQDYLLNYYAGFLYYYEMGNSEKGLKYLTKIADHPKSPVFIRSIINKLKLESGMGLKDVFSLVLHNYNTTKDKTLKHRLKKDLYAIKAELDLECLNGKNSGCDTLDLNGRPYIKDSLGYRTEEPFLLYRIKRKGTN